ncbi:LPXTG cell wall anchor domain-containing protein [Staphylococcus agnetis]|uniref:5'-nucleotidase C-terminal domain-containing protein n=2 Tax=Staphylococcus agnetis TaxID=985762 RepID=UPI000CD1A78E|nr:5'-nucleotidase C-terminal domain-containing protein [Staphylococcus agnetis]MBY7663359.1 5'-nucleotidase C-terminal domain-containing protein [Staphylococcus agnetis]NJH79355.1 LPXTG cell wall anchor domain-containing protein [Staphylococcus agnetis]PNY87435.1 multifunctional 2',3'-cyclic-nucleotide 2'-phosphodiesterase/5'-nucleotidase/3'-nucleotidase [Staphylococcus agnetis]PTH68361.1 multifunctional 2',3'-cyclic-nucleotide 2'-phosphodiesterase/5'-nucleotidase/3'-nucleotidase [Staphylococc
MKRLGFYTVFMMVMILSILFFVPGTSTYAETASPPSEKTTNVQQTSSEPVSTTSSVTQSPSMNHTNKQTSTATTSDASQPQSTDHHVQPQVSTVTADTASHETVNQKESQSAKRTLTGIQSQATTQPKQAQAKPSQTHTILHTNDIHGRLVEEEGRVIGMAKTKTIKDQHQPDLMLDAGDAFQGLPLSNQSKGEEMAKAMNAVGYDAMVAGNHEFDFGYDQLKKLESMLNFPILSSNVYKDGKLAFKPSTIIEKNGVRYGIIGVTTPETKTKTSPTGIKGVTFDDPLKSVLREMDALNGKVDTFVILSHLGVDSTTQETWRSDYLTQQINRRTQYTVPTIVIDGHSHTVMQHGQMYGRDLLAQTGTALANIGKIDFNFANNTVSDLKASLISVKDVAQVQPDPTVKAQVDRANDAFLKETSAVVIPNNTIVFEGERDKVRRHETNLGNAIADAMEAYSKNHFSQPADFAVTNSGGIRASINKGEVTLNHIITVLPFGNTISQIKVKGSDVRAAFEHSLSAPTENVNGTTQLSANGGLLQISKSIRVYYDMAQPAGKRIKAIHVLNKQTGKFEALDLNRTYRIATNDFTASGGDGYTMLNGPREEGLSLDKVFADYLKQADLSQYDTTAPTRIINGDPEALETQEDKVIPFPKQPKAPNQAPLPNDTNQQSKIRKINNNVIVSNQTHHMNNGTKAIGYAPSIQMNSQNGYVNAKGKRVLLRTGQDLLSTNQSQQLPDTGHSQQTPIWLGGLLVMGGMVLIRRYTA